MAKLFSSRVAGSAVWLSVVRASDHPELVRVHAEARFLAQPLEQGRTSVLLGQHVRGLGDLPGEVAGVQGLEIGERVVGREQRMRLGVTLLLGHLVHRLEARPGLGVELRQRPAAVRLGVEHQAVRQVAVVRDCQDAATGLLLVAGHVRPQVLGVHGIVLGEGQGPAGAVGTFAEDDDAVHVVAAGMGGPLESVERREHPRLVVVVRVLDDAGPDGLHHARLVDLVGVSCQRLPVGFASRIGSERLMKSASPRFSAWSATTTKSSGRFSLNFQPR